MDKQKRWNWQQDDWPQFRFDRAVLEAREARFLFRGGLLLGAFCHIGDDDKSALTVDLISDEAIKTSEIEGEFLNRDSVRSSIRRNFGLDTDSRRISSAEQGIADMMTDLYRGFAEPLTQESLFRWHRMLTSGRRDLKAIGVYRTHEDPMQIVSGPINKRKVHFEAPPSATVQKEMEAFITWFNNPGTILPALRAPVSSIFISSPFTRLKTATAGLRARLRKKRSPRHSASRRSSRSRRPSRATGRLITRLSNAAAATTKSRNGSCILQTPFCRRRIQRSA